MESIEVNDPINNGRRSEKEIADLRVSVENAERERCAGGNAVIAFMISFAVPSIFLNAM